MDFPAEQVAELQRIYPGLQQVAEGGTTYFFLPSAPMPSGIEPRQMDLLFCPTAHTGYPSRLFFAQLPAGGPVRNWNGVNVRILDRNWHAASWQIGSGHRLLQAVLAHLDLLTPP